MMRLFSSAVYDGVGSSPRFEGLFRLMITT